MAKTTENATEQVLNYLNTLPPFSKTICTKLREIILASVPGIVEDWKWGPHYNSNGMVCGYAGFKKHVKLTFFNGSAMKDAEGLFNHCVDNEFSRSIKYVDISEVDEKILVAYLRESADVNKKGFKREVKEKIVEVPGDLGELLKQNEAAEKFFNSLSYGYKKEYVELVTTAKHEKTKNERIAKVVAMCAEGRKLNDKYKKS